MPNTEPDRLLDSEPLLHVAVGVIVGSLGRILIARRPDHLHQGGLWEFPGGKIEHGEVVTEALHRELAEELGIRTLHAEPLIRVRHRYPDCHVLLDVWRIGQFAGRAWGREGQEVRWVKLAELDSYHFPAANKPIVCAVQLPAGYAILEGRDENEVLSNLRTILDKKVSLIQLRLKTFASVVPPSLLECIAAECRRHRVSVLLNSALESGRDFAWHGLHLTSTDLMRAERRPCGIRWLAASCHTREELRHAEEIGVDFVVLAPVRKTRSHPETEPMGWRRFAELTEETQIPVYALGGLDMADLRQARGAGAQGIAGISTFQ